MSNLSFSVDIKQGFSKRADLLAKYFPELLRKAVEKTTDVTKRNIIKRTPVKTGAARSSWIASKTGEFEYTISSSVGRGRFYTGWLETGTGIWVEGGQPIQPKVGKMLTFPIKSGNSIIGWVRTKSVNGIAGHFMVQGSKKLAFDTLLKEITANLKKQWENGKL